MGVNNSILSPVSNYLGKRRCNEDMDTEASVPASKKFCPEDTIYEQCFVNGLGHDVVVKIFDKEWKLHKESLIKSPYFASMFSGSWNESTKNEIEIQIPDPHITQKSVNIALGSLYHPDISFHPDEVLSVIASATLFQLDELISHCEDIWLNSITKDNVFLYYEMSRRYNLHKVHKGALSFLLANLVRLYSNNLKLLACINCELMKQLISCPELVTSSSVDIYYLLRLWLYLKVQPPHIDENISEQDMKSLVRNFFILRPKTQSYLEWTNSKEYMDVFKCMELYPLLSAIKIINEIQEDNILPRSWIIELYERLLPFVSEIMHPPVPMRCKLDETERPFYLLSIPEKFLMRHCIKWSSVIPQPESVRPQDKSTWLKWTLSSHGLITEWKYTGSYLKAMFSPSSRLWNDVTYVSLYCRFSIYFLNSEHQIIKRTSKAATNLLTVFKHEDLFSFSPAEFQCEGAEFCMLSVNVLLLHRIILSKLLREKLGEKKQLSTNNQLLGRTNRQNVPVREGGANDENNISNNNNNDDDAHSDENPVHAPDAREPNGENDEADLEADDNDEDEEYVLVEDDIDEGDTDTDNEEDYPSSEDEGEENEDGQGFRTWEQNEREPDYHFVICPLAVPFNIEEMKSSLYCDYSEKNVVQIFVPRNTHSANYHVYE